MNWKFGVMALAASMSFFTACSDDDDDDDDDRGGTIVTDNTVLKGSITSDVTLKAGNNYKLSGEYIVEEGATFPMSEEGRITLKQWLESKV